MFGGFVLMGRALLIPQIIVLWSSKDDVNIQMVPFWYIL